MIGRRLCIAGALALWSAGASAQDADVTSLLREGVAARVGGRDAEALARFTEAHARCRCAEARAQMGLAAQALGRFAAASAWLGEALEARGDRWVERNRAELAAAEAESRARAVTLVLRGEVGASALVDGEPRGAMTPSGTLRLRVDPGPRRVALVAADGRRAETSVATLPGGESALALALPPRPPPAPRARPAAMRVTPWQAAARWAAVAGAAGVAGGSVAFALERRYTALWESPDCLRGNRTREENCAPWRASAERAEAAAIASWAAGGLLLAAAVGLWWIAPREARRAALGCGPVGAAGVVCGGTF